MEGIQKLDSVDIREARDSASRLQKRLSRGRDAAVLGELIDYYFATASKRAAKVLVSLKDAHSQDFFDKLEECLHGRTTRLAVLHLLARILNTQASWLYKIVNHPLFTSMLYYLKTSGDVVVLTSSLLVVTALLPRVPSYIEKHLADIFEIFTQLATIRSTNRLGLTPSELYLNLDVAVYYFFLQLYSLFPRSFCCYLQARYGPTGEVEEFEKYISPLFCHVQFHPGVITDMQSYETSKAKWGSMDPHEIATLSLSFSLDPSIALQDQKQDSASQSLVATATPGEPLQLPLQGRPPFSKEKPGSSHSTPVLPRASADRTPTLPRVAIVTPDLGTPTLLQVSAETSLTGFPATSTPGGLKSGRELAEFWSPSVSLNQVTPGERSYESSRLSMASQSVRTSALSSPVTESAASSTLHTPGPGGVAGGGVFTFKNYSPTASVDSESLLARQLPSMTHSSSGATPSRFEESCSSSQLGSVGDSLHRSAAGSSRSSPIKMLDSVSERESSFTSHSIKVKFEKFVGLFSRKRQEASESKSRDSEEFTVLSESDTKSGSRRVSGRGSAEVGEECLPRFAGSRSVSVGSTDEPNSASLSELAVGSRGSSSEEEEEEEEEEEVGGGRSSGTTEGARPPFPSGSERPLEAILCNSSHLRRFSYADTVCSKIEVSGDFYSSSLPGHPVSNQGKSRSRNAQSETDATVLRVQERLKQLVQFSGSVAMETTDSASTGESSGSSNDEREEPEKSGERGTTQAVGRPIRHPPLEALPSVDSTTTVLASSPQLHGTGPPEENAAQSRLLMRRVSVLSRKGLENSVSEDIVRRPPEGEELDATTGQTLPSPVTLLDRYVAHGEVLHRGRARDIPLTELEGVDWEFFGGCPHSEELGVIQSQVALLHSQLLFERHQCLQHSRRNRRLLSQARDTTRLAEELLSLRKQVATQHGVIQALQTELQRLTGQQAASKSEEKLRADNQSLSHENIHLKDTELRLSEQIKTLTRENDRLKKDLQQSSEQVFSLTSERDHVQPKLTRADQLEREAEQLMRELQVMGELLQRERERKLGPSAARNQSVESRSLAEAAQREKEVSERQKLSLERDVEQARAHASELQNLLDQKNKEISRLHSILSLQEGKWKEKISATEQKYQSILAISQQLESHILELRGKTALRKKPSIRRHKRSSSNPSGWSSLPHTPSPSLPHTPTPPSTHTTPSPSLPHPKS